MPLRCEALPCYLPSLGLCMLKALVGYLPSLEEEPPVFRPAGTGAQPPSLQLMPVMLPRSAWFRKLDGVISKAHSFSEPHL